MQLAFGREVTLDALVQRICCSKESGYMIQERLRPHPAVERLFGPTIGTLRLVVLLGADGQPEIVRSLWKIPAGQNIADNFWRGNLLGCVDADTGMLSRVVAGTGIDQRQVEIHPDTGQHLAGAAVPDWIQVRDLCLRAASSLPGIRTQAWDIAVTDGGPVLVEVNFGGDISLPQIACGRGMLDERYREHLRRCGYKGKL